MMLSLIFCCKLTHRDNFVLDTIDRLSSHRSYFMCDITFCSLTFCSRNSLFSVQPLATAQGSRGHHISTDSLPGASSIDRTSPQLSGTSPDSTSLSALQTLAAAAVKFGTKDIIGIAAAKQASSYSLSMSTAATATAVESLGSLQDITRAAASASAGAASGCSGGDGGGDTAGKKTATSMEDWSNLVTVCHAEVCTNMCVASFELFFGRTASLRYLSKGSDIVTLDVSFIIYRSVQHYMLYYFLKYFLHTHKPAGSAECGAVAGPECRYRILAVRMGGRLLQGD